MFALAIGATAEARNTVTKVGQVAEAVTLTEDVDYVITGTDPFTATGSIDITNTEHAVVIFENIRPSKALEYLGFIKINGENAANDENCQVKMYASGAIIMPYGKDFKPLTVYSEQNFGGESANDFGLENTGGYMNTLSAEKLNNRIRSFKLKRGYMVTFSNSAAGRGYSRCFIADTEDLEVPELPDVMDQHISSYRIFKWYDAEKKGLANDTGTESTQALNVSWCYSFGPGEDKGMDCECVPHKIQINWPGNCGTISYSPHLKTNNEPGNQADHGTEDLDDVLATWEDLMATGKRLCSPSSHDGSLNWLRSFMDSIDARGWRCDILDMHCYWPEWNLNNQLEGWYNDYKRPIWVSEFVWGASWNNNGIFGIAKTKEQRDDFYSYQEQNYNAMSQVLTNWNNYPYVERYAYWNSEANCSKVYLNGELSKLGEFYSTMKSGIGYNKAYEYVPRVAYKAPSGIALTYDQRTRDLKITWNNSNAELTDSTFLEVRINEGKWTTLQKYASSERTSYTYEETFPEDCEKGLYSYRVRNYDMDGKQRMSNEVSVALAGVQGLPGFQYGNLQFTGTEDLSIQIDAPEDGADVAVFISPVSYNNRDIAPVATVSSVSSNRFIARGLLWNEGDYAQAYAEAESAYFMVLRQGTHHVGDLTLEVGESPSKLNNDSTWISFANPFPAGTTPVVIANITTRSTAYPFMVKIWNVTHEGFAVKLTRQAAVDASITTFPSQDIFYVAATPGTARMENGKLLTVGYNTEDKVDGRIREVPFVDAAGNAVNLFNPYVICGPQTDSYGVPSVYRLARLNEKEVETAQGTATAAYSMSVTRQKDGTFSSPGLDNVLLNGDAMGWIAISDDMQGGGTGIASAQQPQKPQAIVQNGRIYVTGTDHYSIYGLNGQMYPKNAQLPNGIYIVKAGETTLKVLVSGSK